MVDAGDILKEYEVHIDNGVPLPGPNDPVAMLDLTEKVDAALKSYDLLVRHGGTVDYVPTEDDLETAGALSATHAHNPEATSSVSLANVAGMTPAALLLTKQILDTFGHRVVDSALKIRETVVNKLIIETENDDARIRLRALELLGKMSDVGLFTEKSEVTVTHQTSEDLRAKLREKLTRLKDVTPAEPEDAVLIEDESDDSRSEEVLSEGRSEQPR